MGALLSAWTPSSPGDRLVHLRGVYLEHSPLCMCVYFGGGGAVVLTGPAASEAISAGSLEAPV